MERRLLPEYSKYLLLSDTSTMQMANVFLVKINLFFSVFLNQKKKTGL